MQYSSCISFALLASVFVSVSTWTLQSTHQNIIPGLTDDVTLKCFHDLQHSSPIVLKTINRIRLLKLDSVSRTWKILAEVTQPKTTTLNIFNQSESGIQLDGHIGDIFSTFLRVTWPISTSGAVGSYKCEIEGFKKGNGADSVIHSSVVNITSNPATVADLLKVIIKMKRRSDELSNELNQKSAQHEDLKKSLQKDIQSSIVDNYYESRYWPSGNYALLAPESGCPTTSSSSFLSGNGTFQTETHTAPNHAFSDSNHLRDTMTKRCGTRNIFKFNLCSSQRTEPGLMWPKGSYCTHYTGDPCPSGLHFGYLKLHLETILPIIITEIDSGDNMYSTGTGSHSRIHMHFCCRSDGDADDVIRLPTLKPFYLYRHKGKCQKVFNMDVSEEWFQIDTNDAVTDKYITEHNPDGKLNDARFQLCYYTKKAPQ